MQSLVNDPHRHLPGFQRVLTSGGESTVLEGLPKLLELIQQADDRITVVPGGGITERNLERIMTGCMAKEFHCSARVSQQSLMTHRRGDIHMGAGFHPPEYVVKIGSKDRISNFNVIYRELNK